MATWSSARPGGRTVNLCPLCHGTRFVHPLMPSREPDLSEVYPCTCSEQYEPGGRDERGDVLTIFYKPPPD